MRRAIFSVLLVLASCVASCAPPACGEGGDASARREVGLLVLHGGQIGDAAADRLVRRGRAAIPVLETGLYTATPAGRRRIIRTLERIDPRASAPIFRHLAEHDPDADVRELAHAAATAAAPP